METEIRYEKDGNKYKKIMTTTITMSKKEIKDEKENYKIMNLNLDSNIAGIEETRTKNNTAISDITNVLGE